MQWGLIFPPHLVESIEEKEINECFWFGTTFSTFLLHKSIEDIFQISSRCECFRSAFSTALYGSSDRRPIRREHFKKFIGQLKTFFGQSICSFFSHAVHYMGQRVILRIFGVAIYTYKAQNGVRQCTIHDKFRVSFRHYQVNAGNPLRFCR